MRYSNPNKNAKNANTIFNGVEYPCAVLHVQDKYTAYTLIKILIKAETTDPAVDASFDDENDSFLSLGCINDL